MSINVIQNSSCFVFHSFIPSFLSPQMQITVYIGKFKHIYIHTHTSIQRTPCAHILIIWKMFGVMDELLCNHSYHPSINPSINPRSTWWESEDKCGGPAPQEIWAIWKVLPPTRFFSRESLGVIAVEMHWSKYLNIPAVEKEPNVNYVTMNAAI